jgi:hypothetical protein
MIEHVTDLLGAYLDGELRGLRLHQVEDHLSKCAACRTELEELRSLSMLLQETIPAEAFTPTDRFVANLSLTLPRRPEANPVRKPLEFLWWAVPAGVLGAWVFLQTVITVSTLVSTADLTGLFGNAATWLQNGSQQSLWFSASMSLFGNQVQGSGQTVLDLLNDFSVFGSSLIMQLVWQAGIALVYWVWLGLWWNRRRAVATPRLSKMPSHS